MIWHAATRRLRQVGTGCLRDFLGGHNPERLCRQAEYVLLARENGPTLEQPPAGRITVQAGGGNNVLVHTFNAAGDPAEAPFHLIVAC